MYERTFIRMFRTFWAKFGWGNVEIIGANSYMYLGFFTLLLCAGILIGLVRNRRKLTWNVVFLLFLSVRHYIFSCVCQGCCIFTTSAYLFTSRSLFISCYDSDRARNELWLGGNNKTVYKYIKEIEILC